MKSLYEELGGTYQQVGDYLIPDIELPERNYEIGKYGRMRHRYIKLWQIVYRLQRGGTGTLLPFMFHKLRLLIMVLSHLEIVSNNFLHLYFVCRPHGTDGAR